MELRREALLGKNLEELRALAVELGFPKFAGGQIAEWLYKRHVVSIDQMTNLSKRNREILSEHFEVGVSSPIDVATSVDGTKKYLFDVGGGRFIEAAYIPDDDRATLCVSSQVGCKMGCRFCMTGRQGLSSNLSAGDIVNQIRSIEEFDKLTNIVYMGMGEPMDNIDNLLRSLSILTSEWGYGWSPKRITVSTVGVMKGLRRFLDESKCHLAVSLHNPFHMERLELMPVENKDSIVDIVTLLKKYDFTGQRRVSFEYIMFDGVNDSRRHVNELVKLLHGLKSRVNLISFHPIPDSELQGSSAETMIEFRDALTSRGIMTTIRRSRGMDIFAACGLLSTRKQMCND